MAALEKHCQNKGPTATSRGWVSAQGQRVEYHNNYYNIVLELLGQGGRGWANVSEWYVLPDLLHLFL